jgi:ATP-dependent DNA ligase
VRLRSRAGPDLTAAFPEIVQAAAEPGEVVAYRAGRFGFGALGRRLRETARLL